MKLELFNEQIFFATVRIAVGIGAGAGASIGTGFLYTVPVAPERSCILLVSNRHVYGDPQNPIQLIFHKRDPSETTRPLLGMQAVFNSARFDGAFTGHPDPDVDLACLNVSSFVGDPANEVFFKSLDESLMPDFDHQHLLPGNEVWFVGYPENRFDTKNNLPILRRGYIASIPKVDFEGRREFLIDAQVFRGSSGSPVFTSLDAKFRLLGVVAQTMIRNERVQSVPTSYALGVQQILGLGIVLKATLLNELFDAATIEIKFRLAQEQPEPTTQTSEVEGATAQPTVPEPS